MKPAACLLLGAVACGSTHRDIAVIADSGPGVLGDAGDATTPADADAEAEAGPNSDSAMPTRQTLLPFARTPGSRSRRSGACPAAMARSAREPARTGSARAVRSPAGANTCVAATSAARATRSWCVEAKGFAGPTSDTARDRSRGRGAAGLRRVRRRYGARGPRHLSLTGRRFRWPGDRRRPGRLPGK